MLAMLFSMKSHSVERAIAAIIERLRSLGENATPSKRAFLGRKGARKRERGRERERERRTPR